jgi:putative Holliday junction resolvase
MKILSIDPGDARTGLAACDEGERLAYPVGTIFEYNRMRLIERIALEAEKLGVSHILVGNPINMNGTSGLRSAASQDLADGLRLKTAFR